MKMIKYSKSSYLMIKSSAKYMQDDINAAGIFVQNELSRVN